MSTNTLLQPDAASWSTWLCLAVIGLLPLAVPYGLASSPDVLLLLLFVAFRNWEWALRILQSYESRLVFGVAGSIVLTFGLTRIAKWLKRRKKSRTFEGIPPDESPKPLFFPSRTTHTRLFPKYHSFSYSYLLVGIPVGWRGSIGGMLAADQGASHPAPDAEEGWASSAWYTVNAADYLDRGHGHLGLDGKLKQYLTNEVEKVYIDPVSIFDTIQGENHEEYQYAYLITAPRLLGYSFNPVSFWYLYNKDCELAGMILEVNNTFDERHLYFLKSSQNPTDGISSLEEPRGRKEDCLIGNSFSTPAQTNINSSSPTKFSKSWAKEFHVSPFNSRKGSYSLISYDPLYPSMTGLGPVNNTVTLLSSKHHPKLVARIASDGVAVDPEAMSEWQKLIFLSLWGWTGFVTFPRIVCEASKLFFKRKLHVWFRPEPLKSSIGRNADTTEQLLERSFRKYLHYLVEVATLPLVVKYTPAGIKDASGEIITSPLVKSDSPGTQALELKVLTPIFYSRFVRYAHDLEAIFSEFNENGTIWVSSPHLLPNLLLNNPQPPQYISGWVDYLSFKVIQNLRQRSPKIEGTTMSVEKGKTRNDTLKRNFDIRTFRLSAMDGYFLGNGTLAERREYREPVLKLLISDRIAFGNVEILTAGVFLLKCGVFWIVVRTFPL